MLILRKDWRSEAALRIESVVCSGRNVSHRTNGGAASAYVGAPVLAKPMFAKLKLFPQSPLVACALGCAFMGLVTGIASGFALAGMAGAIEWGLISAAAAALLGIVGYQAFLLLFVGLCRLNTTALAVIAAALWLLWDQAAP